MKASSVTWTEKRNVREENDLKKGRIKEGKGMEEGGGLVEGGWDGCCYCV